MPGTTNPNRSHYGETPPLEIIPPHPQLSFRTLTHDYPSEICGWGFHPEYEIHLITQSTGSFIAGDYIGTFEPGQVTLLGPNLPHDWVSDVAPDEVLLDRDAVVQFTDEWIRSCIELMPETTDLLSLLHRSKRGLSFTGHTGQEAAEIILRITRSQGTARISGLFTLLTLFVQAPESDVEYLCSEFLDTGSDMDAQGAAQAGLKYIFANLTGDIRLSTAAQLAYMSEPSFSKYFKRAAGMTFSDMVKKLRIAHAQRLLDSTNDPVTTVATASGYRNLANFNRQFLAEVGMTPTAYRRLDKDLRPQPALLARATRALALAEAGASGA